MRRSVSALGSVALAGLSAAALVPACAVPPTGEVTDADSGSLHALVSIERTVNVREGGEARGEAFAGFLEAPPEVDSGSVLKLAGLARDLPSEGECVSGRERDANLPPLKNVSLVDVGDLSIRVGDGITELAPRAFPTVADLVSGVVYTTRDRAAEGLPAHASYLLTASGGSLPPFTTQAEAPTELEAVLVNGAPLAELEALPAHAGFTLSWTPGEARDSVYLEVADDAGQKLLQCAFRDDAGAAAVPAGLLAGTGNGTLGLHRLRTGSFTAEGMTLAELRFDFELETDVTFE